IAYSAVLILVMLAVLLVMQKLVGETRLGRRSTTPAPTHPVPGSRKSCNIAPLSLRSLPPRGLVSPSGRPFGTEMKHPPTLASLAAPQGAGQPLGAALRN